ncbi:Rib/alpha-like domain-containing protein [Streptococcus suis]|uniref:Rib/alpha-like domain-containing protein n=1 Tax=Streptococcus suis TaxID=1307 RepID=UPI000C176F57|nr:Rib/alpha-like domain-containing protein [Streptococcus suis]
MNNKSLRDEVNELLVNYSDKITVAIKDSFFLDVEELMRNSFISKESFLESLQRLVQDIIGHLNSQSQSNNKSKNIIYDTYKNGHEQSLNGHRFNFDFYYNPKENKLVFIHFDKLIPAEKVAKKRDFFISLIVIATIFAIHAFNIFINNYTLNMKSVIISLILPLLNLILFFVVKCRDNKNVDKAIWVNKNSIDLFRKWFRSRQFSEWTKWYYFISWLNLWIFCMILLVLIIPIGKDALTGLLISFFILSSVVALIGYSVNYLLKMVNLNYWNTILLTLILFLIGFFSKDNWVFVALIFVIVNQILSKDIVYLSNNFTVDEQQSIEKKLITNRGHSNEIKMKFQVNIAIVIVYLIIIIINDSKLLKPFLTYISPQIPLPDLLITGIERIVLMVFLLTILKSSINWIANIRREILGKIQILFNHTSEKLYGELKNSEPIFRESITLFHDEEIKPEEVIENFQDLPLGVKVIWSVRPDWTSNQTECTAEIVVIYADRSYMKHSVHLKKMALDET